MKNSNKRVNLLFGGAGSSKSYSIAQHLIEKAYTEKNKRFLVTRKTLPFLRLTAYKLILDLLKEYKLPYHHNHTELILTTPSESEIIFKSIDEPEKIKSSEFNYIWVEEVTEINYDDYLQLNLRLRRNNELSNQMFLSCNPISRLSWVYRELVEKPSEDIAIQRSTYKDNPFVDKEYKKYIENLINIDLNYYKIYTLGEWGILKNTIYSNYETINDLPENMDEVFYGLDFGYNNPSSLIMVGIKDQTIYLKELIYESKLTNTDLISLLTKMLKPQSLIYADTAEPNRIQEICNAGYNCKPSDKDVKTGLDFCKRQKLYVSSDSINFLKEIGGYKYKEDKDGNVLDEPVKFNDHLMDAMRYALYTHMGKPVDMFFKIG